MDYGTWFHIEMVNPCFIQTLVSNRIICRNFSYNTHIYWLIKLSVHFFCYIFTLVINIFYITRWSDEPMFHPLSRMDAKNHICCSWRCLNTVQNLLLYFDGRFSKLTPTNGRDCEEYCFLFSQECRFLYNMVPYTYHIL